MIGPILPVQTVCAAVHMGAAHSTAYLAVMETVPPGSSTD